MARNPRVAAAFRAMKALGIAEEAVKPVLKNLLKLYDKNWELIEEENYRALADAIFEYEETKVAEQKKKTANTCVENTEEETLLPDEPERPLKRLRRTRDFQTSNSPPASDHMPPEASLRRPKEENLELLDTSHSHNLLGIRDMQQPHATSSGPESQTAQQLHLRNKGKQPVSPNRLVTKEIPDVPQACAQDRNQSFVTDGSTSEAFSSQMHIKDRQNANGPSPPIIPREKRCSSQKSSQLMLSKQKVVSGIVLSPKNNVPDNHLWIQPKDEPVDDMAQFEVPIAIMPPDASTRNNSAGISGCPGTRASQSINQEKDEKYPVCNGNKYDLANSSDGYPNLEIASSSMGEVKISLSCNFGVGRPDFPMRSLEEVLKRAEDKCLKSYKIIDPNFSVSRLMKDMCECFLELGNESRENSSKSSTDSTLVLGLSHAPDAPAVNLPSGPLNGSNGLKVSFPEILKLPSSLNSVDKRMRLKKKAFENNCVQSDYGKDSYQEERNDEREIQDTELPNSHSLVVVHNHELTPEHMRALYDANDITKGQERVKISWANEVNNEYPPPFHYIPHNLIFQNAYVNFPLARIGDENCCSTCFGDCLLHAEPCACAREIGGDFAYTRDGLVKEDFLDECISMNQDPQQHHQVFCKACPLERAKNDEILESCKGHLVRKFIKECWSKCGCNKQCGNRVVQRGITCNLQVFFTPERKGWGLRTVENLPKGAFVCEYVGEILTNAELYDRNMQNASSHSYPVLLDADWGSEEVLKDEEALCLDATCYGNVARFINHRCLDANLVEIPVEIETPDHHYYHLAFFTTRRVYALEELTWDYGIDFDDNDHPVKAFRCQCGSKFCRNIKRSKRSRSRSRR